MNKYLKILGYVFASFLLIVYLVFLLVLPNAINLNNYKNEIQKLVTENTGLNLDFDNAKLITSPFLEAGVKVKNIKVTLPDNSVLFSADSVKGKVYLPSLLLLTVRVTCADVEKPNLNMEIFNGENFKVSKVFEDLVNQQRVAQRSNPTQNQQNNSELPLDVSKIKVIIPSLRLNNYSAVIDDVAASHKLTLKGEELRLGYFNGKKAKLKTSAKLLSDDNTNIIANIDLETFIPEFPKSEPQRIDNEEVFSIPFVNPVSVYRDYDLHTNVNSKMTIRKNKNDGKLVMNGFLDIEDTTITMSGLVLPKSYFRLKSKGTVSNIDTNIYFTDKEFINLFGTVDYGKKPYIDFNLKSPQVQFANILNITKAYLDTIHIQNDIKNMSASGFILANAHFRTDFSEIISDGKIIIRNGNFIAKNTGLFFNNLYANIFFDDNILRVQDSHVLINNKSLKVSGRIDNNSIANFEILADKIPLKGLYSAFAPRNIKQAYDLTSGILSVNAKVTGEIKDIAALLKTDLEKLVIKDRAGNFVLSNNLMHFTIANYQGTITGKLTNKDFRFTFPKTESSVRSELLVANLDNRSIRLKESTLLLNKNSKIKINGNIKNYLSAPDILFTANGNLLASDLGLFAGKEAIPYFIIKGSIPIKSKFESVGNKMKLIVQARANSDNYITPIKIDELQGKQTLFQLIVAKNGDTLKINHSGLYTRSNGAPFRNKLYSNLSGTNEIISMRAIVSNLSVDPFINLFKITTPRTLNGSICVFDKSRFNIDGHIFAYGKVASPRINGHFNLRNLQIPEIYTSMRDAVADFNADDIKISLNDISANGSDFRVLIQSNRDLISKMILSDVKVFSKDINVDKLLLVSEALTKTLPQASNSGSNSSTPADIPLEIQKGSINFEKIKSGDIVAKGTTGRISLAKNVFYLNSLRAHSMGGVVTGDVSMNLVTTLLNAVVKGKNFDVENVFADAVGMKDTLSGDMNFLANVSLMGLTIEEQMKSLKGFIDFNVKNGQLGPFGKFENFLMAENIRENAFFSTTIGSVITNLVTIDTSHFNELYGHLTFADGIADIAPIKSQGDVMSMYIAGKMNLLDNTADMKVRGKLASVFSDMLGPLSNINPINLVKHTPGLNVVAAKAFMIFCEAVSEEEMKALPQLAEGKSDENATKFQIVLRGDTRKPLKMIKSFKWLALDSDIQSAQDFVDTIPTPVEGEEGLSVEELIKLREDLSTGVNLNSLDLPNTKNEGKKYFIKKSKNK